MGAAGLRSASPASKGRDHQAERDVSGRSERIIERSENDFGRIACVRVLSTRLLSTVPSFGEAKYRMRSRLVDKTHGGRGR